MKKDPKDGGRYRRSAKAAKAAASKIARTAEKEFGLPSGSVRVCLTKLPAGTRDRIVKQFTS